MKSLKFFAILACSLTVLACQENNPDDPNIDPEPQKDSVVYDVTYAYDNSIFINPERGWYSGLGLTYNNGSKPSVPSVGSLKTYRGNSVTIPIFQVYLNDFVNTYDLPDYVISTVGETLKNFREAGLKAVLRFAYSWSDPPVQQDASPEICVHHIQQLKPVFQEYWDVIFVVQAGFIGRYGEWAGGVYTDYYKDKTLAVDGVDQDGAANRRKVIFALLDAVPQNRQIEMRTISAKMSMLQSSYADSITFATAFDGSVNSRLGGHNDCFLYSSNDAGTFGDGKSRKMWQQESRFTIMGGETCGSMYDETYCNCDNSLLRLSQYHFTYLNYTSSPTNPQYYWKEHGCYDEIEKRLGYRLFLTGATFSEEFRAGGHFSIQYGITNEGFASLMNERKLEFVLMNVNNEKEKYTFVSDVDPRRWEAGCHYDLEEDIELPATLKSGETYELFFNLPDIATTLHDNPYFSVRLANKRIWNSLYGYNSMGKFTAE